MAYQLMAIDIDGTLIGEDGRISEQDKAAVKKALDRGVHIILASGRGYQGIVPTARALGISDYTIASIGQAVDVEGNVVHANYLPPLTTKQIMRFAALRDIHFQAYLDDTYHYRQRNEYIDTYERFCGYEGVEDPDIMDRKVILATKLILRAPHEVLEQVRMEAQPLFPDINICYSMDTFLEFPAPDATKGNALAFIGGKLGIEPGQMIAIGDSDIDESMLEYAGLAVAVENATPALKEMADFIAVACEENPVAQVIEKYILSLE